MIMSEQTHIDIVTAGFDNEKSDDEILRELFETGIPFNELRTIFNEVVKSQGLRLSASERKEKTAEILEGWNPETSEEVSEKAVSLASTLKLTEPKGLTAIRAWAKANDIELPKPERKPKVPKLGFGGHIRTLLDFLKENRQASRDDVNAYCEQNEISPKYTSVALNVMAFADELYGTDEVAKEAPKKKARK